jgi:hypothetical protein
MKPAYLRERFFLACIALLAVSLQLACSTTTPTEDIRSTELPETELPFPSSTPEPTFKPIIGEQTLIPVVQTPLPVQDRTLTPSSTPAPSETPIPTETLTPMPTSTAPIIWGAGNQPPITIDRYKGQWLSVQQMMVGNFLDQPASGSVSLLSGPRFALETVATGSNRVLGSEFTSGPSGRWILFGSVAEEDYVHEWNENSTLTRLNSQDRRLQVLLPDLGSLRWVSFPGWMDGNTTAMSDYAGGGFYNHTIVDVANNTLISRAQVHGPAWRPNSAYFPMAEEYGGPYQLFVLARSTQSDPFDSLLGPNIYTRGFPSEYIAPDMNTIFKGWLSDTNLMLVQAFIYNRNTSSITYSQLMLWGVDTQNILVIVQAAIDGKFSPDGKQLAYITMGAAPLTPDGQPSFDLGPQVHSTYQAYIQLMDVNTRKVSLSLPVITLFDRSMPYTLDIYATPVDFSPDSRYLAFLTPGLLLIDQTGKLIVLPVSQESAPYLSVLDLSTFQPLLSTPLGTTKDFYFSPTSDRLVFFGKDSNWYILRLATSQVLPMTVNGGERLQWNGWSYDGFYYSLYEPMEDRLGRTYIFGRNP